ncbi:DNA-binding transcriptional regulator, LysR family [Collimonas sp. OK607]|nr:DNA-binding transcriptional regulator, LysR family [Collimonas sp. OK607]
MRLRHIEIFSAIMQTGSTIGAAKLLHVTQPAVSKTLRHAEQTVGFALFVRSKGKLVPTPEALLLQQELLPFDEQLVKIRRLAANLAGGTATPLRIAATPALAHHLVPRAVALWTREYPGSMCQLAASHTREMLYSLLLNEVDLGLTMQPISHPNLITTVLRNCEIYAIAPPGWWPKNSLNRPLQPEELSGQPFISIDIKAHLGAAVSSWLSGVFPPPEVKVSVQTYTLARALVEANIGIAVVDSYTARAAGSSASVLQMRRIELPVNSYVYALTNRSRPFAIFAAKKLVFGATLLCKARPRAARLSGAWQRRQYCHISRSVNSAIINRCIASLKSGLVRVLTTTAL